MAIDSARAKSLFLAASDLADAAERAAYLDRECAGNAELRARVEALLRANDASPLPPAGSPLTADLSAAGLPPTGDLPAEGNTASFGSNPVVTVDLPGRGEHVGAILGGKYKLIEEIGEGGMGSVFMAQQTEPVKRPVAVKVIKAGMDSKAVLARFEAERQALAMMDHPNIARVLDAGTTESGRPYFVMELVKGKPITQYCDERKLTPRQRLELFVPVCQAIQHAHQKGVIHRDIKPSNVLVAMYDDRPVPKVIDFGVAKAAGQTLTDKTLMTGFGAVIGTPEYMSPEQANLNNLDIDTRSDVYSLGVLLYELLTGTTPVDRKSLGKAAILEILRIVREVEAPKPSAKLSTIDTLPSVAACRGTEPAKLSKLMKGELDWVVLKALEKDRTRRYDTAIGLARDVERHLNGDAVEACPPTLRYRLKKAYQRNKIALRVASAFFCLVLLAVGMGAYVLYQRFARQAATEQAVTESLSKATLLRGQAKAAPVGDLTKWTEAIAAARQAEASLETGQPSDALRQRVAELVETLEREQGEAARLATENEKDRKLFARIEAIRLKYVDADEVWYYGRDSKSPAAADEAYAAAFREFGVDVDQLDPAEAGRLLRQRSQPLQIALAIDAWALIRKDLGRNHYIQQRDPTRDRLYQRLIELARIIDDDPWRCSIRAKIDTTDSLATRLFVQDVRLLVQDMAGGKQTAGSHGILQLLNNEKELAKQPARALYVIALILEHSRGNTYDKPKQFLLLPATSAMLKRAWQLSPNDFQICWMLSQQCPDEQDRNVFAMAAAAAAPDSPFARKRSSTYFVQSGEDPLLQQSESILKGEKDKKPPEWKFPHLVIVSVTGDKVYLGPTRYAVPTDEENHKRGAIVGELRWAIRLNPTSVELRELQAKALVRLGRYDEAMAECEAIIKIDPKKHPANVVGNELYGMGQLDRVKEVILRKFQGETNASQSALHGTLGAILWEQGDRAQAFLEFGKAYLNHGPQATMWRAPMQCAGTTDQILAAYRAWFADKTIDNDIVDDWADYLRKLDRREEAIGVYRAAMARDGGGHHLDRLCDLLLEAKRPDEAIALYQTAMAHDGGGRHLDRLSELLLKAKRPDEAIALYQQAVAREPKNIEFRLKLARLYGQTGKAAERIAQLHEVIPMYRELMKTERDEYGWICWQLAEVYIALGNRDEGRKHYREWIQKTPSIFSLNGFAMDYAANYQPERRDGELAVEAATRACELTGWSNPMVLDTLATAYAETGDFDAAVKWQLKAIEMIDRESDREELEHNLKLFREKKKVPPIGPAARDVK